MHANIEVLYAVSKTSVISFVSLNLTQKYNQNVQLKLFQLHIKFHPNQLKSLQRKWSQQVLPCADLVTLGNVSESATELQKSMAPISMTGLKKFGHKFPM